MSTNAAKPANKPIRRYRNEMVLALLIILLGIGVFLFFKSFFDTSPNSLATEILAAFLGSIITVMITMLLIRQQGTFEHAHETAATNKTKIFEKKLELFRDFIQHYVKCAIDGKLDSDELAELEERALTISLLTSKIPKEGHKNLGEELCFFVLKLQESSPKSDGRLENWSGEQFVEIMKLMKIELGVAQSIDPDSEDVDDLEAYSNAKKLIDYRGYRKK